MLMTSILVGENIDAIQKNTEATLDAIMEVDLKDKQNLRQRVGV
jgi:hypothetical protein